ncbi:proteasome maturation protein-like [Dysidea avara]|uniref:proteasome maturation protein-like n=1 Tax=Dysidea avara TaxID=196820 RepID=UPI00332DA316
MNTDTASVKPKPTPATEVAGSHPAGIYGAHDPLRYGVASAKSDVIPAHPLEYVERHYEVNKEELSYQALRHSQGLHAPLKLKMERMLVSKVGRMPPLHSSNLAMDTLTGRDETVEFCDYLNVSWDTEVNVDGHLAMEKKLKML